MKSKFELGSALLKLIKIKTMENRCVTASFAKTAINLRIEQVLHEKVVKLQYAVTYEFGICNSRFILYVGCTDCRRVHIASFLSINTTLCVFRREESEETNCDYTSRSTNLGRSELL